MICFELRSLWAGSWLCFAFLCCVGGFGRWFSFFWFSFGVLWAAFDGKFSVTGFFLWGGWISRVVLSVFGSVRGIGSEVVSTWVPSPWA